MSAMSGARSAARHIGRDRQLEAQIIPTRLTFVDIAGLVRGASKGEGLGNQFLANIREVDAIAHVVRCFEDTDVTHVEGKIDPIDDIETIETELMLADLDSLEKRLVGTGKNAKGRTRKPRICSIFVNRCLSLLREGKPARLVERERRRGPAFPLLGLLSSKPVLYVCNVEEASADKGNTYSDKVKARAAQEGANAVVISAKIESEIAVLPEAERRDYLDAVGLAEPGLNRVIRAGYELLASDTYFTVGPKEARAWTMNRDHARRKPPASSIPISKRDLSAPKPLPIPIMSTCSGEAGARDAGSFGLKARITWSPTAMSCISASPIDATPLLAPPRRRFRLGPDHADSLFRGFSSWRQTRIRRLPCHSRGDRGLCPAV